mmetsp:Transcript_7065/g.30103  ORF Transcript_7065/g.30103 Transcript_7065/m.30103 type:complete len:301 (+) Transcript_7065:3316-4218(+)
MAGSSGAPGASCRLSSDCQLNSSPCSCSMRPTRPISSRLARLSARPSAPARPVRPTRWTCCSTSALMSTLITQARLAMSRPRAATSVATSTEALRLANWISTWSRSRCSRSPCSANAMKPCAASTASRSRHCCLVLQKAMVDSGRKARSSRGTASSRCASLTSKAIWRMVDAAALVAPATFTVCGSRMNFCASSCTPSGKVAENSSVCRWAGVRLAIALMSSTKPMSSMRSASSSTSVFRADRSSVPRSRWSSSRPGVPTAMWAPKDRLSAWGLNGLPPHRLSTLMLSAARARRRISCVT